MDFAGRLDYRTPRARPTGTPAAENGVRRGGSARRNPETGANYIEVYDPGTGEQISNKQVNDLGYYQVCIAGYDEETNCYITVSADDEVVFIDVSSGEVKKTYKLDYHLSDVKFLRR